MKTLALSLILVAVSFAKADPVTPGTLHVLKPDQDKIDAAPGDIVVAQIPNPALARRVSDLDVKVTGGGKFLGAVNAERVRDGMTVPGGTHINIYVSVNKGVRSATLEYSYKDGAGTEHQRRVTIQIEGGE